VRRPRSSTPSPGAGGGGSTAARAEWPLLEKMDASPGAEVSPPVVEKMDVAARSKPVAGPSSRGAPSLPLPGPWRHRERTTKPRECAACSPALASRIVAANEVHENGGEVVLHELLGNGGGRLRFLPGRRGTGEYVEVSGSWTRGGALRGIKELFDPSKSRGTKGRRENPVSVPVARCSPFS
jgi:hypothetical protein